MKIIKKVMNPSYLFILIVLMVIAFTCVNAAGNSDLGNGDITSLNVNFDKDAQKIRINGSYQGNASDICISIFNKSNVEVFMGTGDMSITNGTFDKTYAVNVAAKFTADNSPYKVVVFTDQYGKTPGTGPDNGDGSSNYCAVYILTLDSNGYQVTTVVTPTPTPGQASTGGTVTTPNIPPVAMPASTPMPLLTSEPTISSDGRNSNVQIEIKAIKETDGKAYSRLLESTVDDLAAKTKKLEASGQNVVVELMVEAAANAIEVVIPGEAFNKLAEETKAEMKVNSGFWAITFDEKAVDFINSAANDGNISIIVNKVEASALAKSIQQKVGDRPVFGFLVKAGNDEISKFGSGKAEIRIPYSIKADELDNSIVIFSIGNDGKLNIVRSKYNTRDKTVGFLTGNLSKFAIVYNPVSFNDVAEEAWYNKAVSFMSARSIINGVGEGSFDPESEVIRADYLIMIMKSYGIEVDGSTYDNFNDAGNSYYTPYLAKAKQLGLITGVGDNNFAPEATISRQDMFVILYRALEKLGELPQSGNGKMLESFNDTDDIASYAKVAIKLFVETGITSGDGFNLTPKSTSTRSQAAQILYNLLSK